MFYFYAFWAALILGIILIVTKKLMILGKILLNLSLIAAAVVITFFAALILVFTTARAWIYLLFLMVFAVTVVLIISCLIWGVFKKKRVYIPLLCTLVLTLVPFSGYTIYGIYINNIPTVGESNSLLYQYAPYADDSKVAMLNEPSTLMLENELPILDGATALYPVYSAFAKAVYPKTAIEDHLTCAKTTQAYQNIVTGNADMIFVAAPSKKQSEYAKEQGVELIFTPIGTEAFVFFVNAKNPLDDISIEQIQQIYSGEITDWNELGVNLGKIRAFQRDEGSGSQSALENLMQNKELITPPTNDVVAGMSGIITQTADYKNHKNALGFSFRFYSTEMVKNNQIKLLRITGVYPNTENIENGTYPLASDFYVVTRSDASEHTKLLLEWILSEQGQSLIELTGYTPLH